MKWHNILKQSFLTKPPTHFCVISFVEEMPKPKDCSRWMTSIHGKNKYRDKSYEYLTQVELGEEGNFHIHLL